MNESADQIALFTKDEAPQIMPKTPIVALDTDVPQLLGSEGELYTAWKITKELGLFCSQMSPDGVRNDLAIDHPTGLIGVQVKASQTPKPSGKSAKILRYQFTLKGIHQGEFDLIALYAADHLEVAFIPGDLIKGESINMGAPNDYVPTGGHRLGRKAVWKNVDNYPLQAAIDRIIRRRMEKNG